MESCHHPCVVSGSLGSQLAVSVNDWVAADCEATGTLAKNNALIKEDQEKMTFLHDQRQEKGHRKQFKVAYSTICTVDTKSQHSLCKLIEPPVSVRKMGRTHL